MTDSTKTIEPQKQIVPAVPDSLNKDDEEIPPQAELFLLYSEAIFDFLVKRYSSKKPLKPMSDILSEVSLRGSLF